MKNIRLALFAIIILGSFNAGYASQEHPYDWDFGRVKEGDILAHSFIIKNDSQKLLVINDLQTSCSCTVSEISSRHIPSGGTGEIKVTVDTSGYRGAMTQYVYVQTDDPSRPIIKLTIKAGVASK
ncbi:MAG: DUF1573 domain-containing protein [Candidatus Omnitrophica bacterium]|nr:DUF1573 domain-containing protein [Candidatus Omnitrophota bacterium]MDD5654021.1 DUF1573 domain-containing protein [Candidatus Omnitrophota bacterium]